LSWHDGAVNALAILRTNDTGEHALLSGGEDGWLHVWRTRTDTWYSCKGAPTESGESINCIAVQGRTVASGGSVFGTIHLWRVGADDSPPEVQRVVFLQQHYLLAPIRSLHVFGSTLLCGEASGQVCVWDTSTGTQLPQLHCTDGVKNLTVLSDGTIVGGGDGHDRLTIWQHYINRHGVYE